MIVQTALAQRTIGEEGFNHLNFSKQDQANHFTLLKYFLKSVINI